MSEERNLEQLKTILKNRYRANDKIERLFYPEHPLPLAECYLDLGLVEEQVIKQVKDESRNESESRQNTETDLSGREHFLHEYERIQHIQKKLAVNTLLDECKSDKKRIYIEGAAGAGKSTLSRFIANEWANDKAPWNRYDWVFYIRLRDLTDKRYTEQQTTLLQVLERECFRLGDSNNLNKNEKGVLNDTLRTSVHKILFVLDGYDELQLNINYIINLWEGIINSDYNLLITSRPGAQLPKNNLGINLNLAVLGFSDEQVERYVSNFFNQQHTPTVNPQDEENCLALLKNNPNLWSLAHTPVQLEMLCSSWSELKKEQDLPLTQLYRVIVNKLFSRYLADKKNKKNCNFTDKTVNQDTGEHFIVYMEYLSFVAMCNKKVVIDKLDMDKALNIIDKEYHNDNFFLELKKIGLFKRNDDGQKGEFAHLTFQEFFAARYLAKAIKVFSQKAIKVFSQDDQHSLPQHDLLDFIGKTKWDSFYEVMWWFVAGLLGGKPQKHNQALESYKFNNGDSNEERETELVIPKSHQQLQTLQTFFDLLLQAPREELEVFELPLLVKCLDEAGMPDIMQKEAIKNHVEIWLGFYWSRYELKESVINQLFHRMKTSSALVQWMEPIFLKMLRNANPSVRQLVVEAVGRLGQYATNEMKQVLLDLMLNKNLYYSERVEAINAVGTLGLFATPEMKSAVLDLLKDKDSRVREMAIRTIGQLGPHATNEMKQVLLDLMLNKNLYHSERIEAINAVSTLGLFTTHEMNHTVLDLLKDKDSRVREMAIRTIGQLGPHATNEMKQVLLDLMLNKNLYHSERIEAINAVSTLGLFATPEMKSAVLDLLKDEDSRVRMAAAPIVLSELSIAETEKLLLKLLGDQIWYVRALAAQVINLLDQPRKCAVKKSLVELMKDKHAEVREAAIVAVSKLGLFATDEMKKILFDMMFQDEDEHVRKSAVRAVKELDCFLTNEIKCQLLFLLEDDNNDKFEIALELMGELLLKATEDLRKELLVFLSEDNRYSHKFAVQMVVELLKEFYNEKIQKELLTLMQDTRHCIRLLSACFVSSLASIGQIDNVQKHLLILLKDDKNEFYQITREAVYVLVCCSTENSLEENFLDFIRGNKKFLNQTTGYPVGILGNIASELLIEECEPLIELGSLLFGYESPVTQVPRPVNRSKKFLSNELKECLLSFLQYKQSDYYLSMVEEDRQISSASKKKLNLILLCQEIFKDQPAYIPPSRLISSSKDTVKVNDKGEFDCLKLCGTVLENIIQDGGSHNLTETTWTLAVVRKKSENNVQARSSSSFFKPIKDLLSHAFLVLEGVKDGVRFATKIDLSAEDSSSSQSSGQKIKIEITTIGDFRRFDELADKSCCMVHGISKSKAEKLLQIVERDKGRADRGEMLYSLTGDSSLSVSNQPKHSCISWCLEKWQEIGLPLKRKWHDVFVMVPKAYLSEEEQSDSSCLVL